jgi:hypothetical protein
MHEHSFPPLRSSDLDAATVKKYFERNDLSVIDEKQALESVIKGLLNQNEQPVCLLLMSSGTFDGIDWNTVCSQQN